MEEDPSDDRSSKLEVTFFSFNTFWYLVRPSAGETWLDSDIYNLIFIFSVHVYMSAYNMHVVCVCVCVCMLCACAFICERVCVCVCVYVSV